MEGKLIILAAPSGSGKSTIVKYLMENEDLNLHFSISATSRAPRGTEKNGVEYFFMTRYGKVPPSSIDFKAASEKSEIYLIFGKESTGIPGEILRANLDRCFRIPMAADCRCLNVSNAAAVAIYEVLRQLNYPGLSFKEEQKGEDFLEQNYSYDETLRRKRK